MSHPMLHDTHKHLLEVASLPTIFAEQKLLCSFFLGYENQLCMNEKQEKKLHLYRELVFATQGKEREFVTEAVAGQF